MKLPIEIINWSYFIVTVVVAAATMRTVLHAKRPKKGLVNWLWRKQYRQVIVVMTVVASWLLVFADNFFSVDITASDEAAGLLLLVTAAIVFWYTRETFDLKVIQQKQKAIQQKQFEFEHRPYIRIAWSEKGGELLHITNQGNGIARDVFIEAVRVDDGSNPRLVFKPRGRAVIAPGETEIVTTPEIQQVAGLESTDVHGRYTTEVKHVMDDRLSAGNIEKIHLSYMDLGGTVYDAIFKPREDVKGRFLIESQEKR